VNSIKWFFMSKYNKLMHRMNVCKNNKQVLHLCNGIVLDFENNAIYYDCELK
jgi:hypothetical protein